MSNLSDGVSSFLDCINTLQDDHREVSFVLIHQIVISLDQPRRYFDPLKHEKLKYSVQKYGILEPLIVRPSKQEGKYEIVAGERRYRAAKDLKLDSVPVVIRDLDDYQSLQIALIENLQREDLNPIEETRAILKLLELELKIPVEEVKSLLYRMSNKNSAFTKNKNNVVPNSEDVVKEIFDSIGKITWESFIKHRLGLLNIAPELLEAVDTGRIEYTKAKAIDKVKDVVKRVSLLETAIAKKLPLSEIRKRVKNYAERAKANHKLLPEQKTYQQRLKDVQNGLKKVNWENPKQKKEFENLLSKLETMINSSAQD